MDRVTQQGCSKGAHKMQLLGKGAMKMKINMNASQLMSRNLVTCRPEDSLQQAAGMMWDHDIGCLPVVDADGRVVGIITDRDACMAAYTQGRTLSTISVESAMAHQVFCCFPTDRIEAVEELMKTKQVRRVPIIDPEGRLVGLIAINDIVRESARELTKKSQEVPAKSVVSALASVCQPRQPSALRTAAE